MFPFDNVIMNTICGADIFVRVGSDHILKTESGYPD